MSLPLGGELLHISHVQGARHALVPVRLSDEHHALSRPHPPCSTLRGRGDENCRESWGYVAAARGFYRDVFVWRSYTGVAVSEDFVRRVCSPEPAPAFTTWSWQ